MNIRFVTYNNIDRYYLLWTSKIIFTTKATKDTQKQTMQILSYISSAFQGNKS